MDRDCLNFRPVQVLDAILDREIRADLSNGLAKQGLSQYRTDGGLAIWETFDLKQH